MHGLNNTLARPVYPQQQFSKFGLFCGDLGLTYLPRCARGNDVRYGPTFPRELNPNLKNQPTYIVPGDVANGILQRYELC